MTSSDQKGERLLIGAQERSGREEGTRWALGCHSALVLAVLFLLLSLGVAAWRVSLPSDGWVRKTPALLGGQYIYEHTLGGEPTPFQPGDILVAIDGQPVADLVARALAFQSRRPEGWAAGAAIPYTVLRGGQEVTVTVTLRQVRPGDIIDMVPAPFRLISPILILGSLAVYLLRPRDRAARLFLLLLWVMGIVGPHESAGPADLMTPGLYWAGTVWLGALLWMVAVVPLQLHFFLEFPVRKEFLARHPRAVLALLYGAFPLLFGTALLVGGDLPGQFWSTLHAIDKVIFLLVIPANLAIVIHSFVTVQEAIARAQLRWLALGLVLGLGGGQVAYQLQVHLYGASAWLGYVTLGLILLFPLSVAVAILRYRLWQIDLIIHRSLVYGTLTALVAAVYASLVALLGQFAQSRSEPVVGFLATGIVAIFFQPLHERVQRAVSRLMYGERDDPYAVLSRLGRRLEAVYAPDAILPVIVETVAQALKLPYAAIELRHGESYLTASAYGDPVENPVILPLTYQSQSLGRMLLGQRRPDEPFTPAELRLLEDLARQAGGAAYAVRLTAELQLGRQRLVTAREEERRRLHRDLHDGLGPHLAGLTLKLESARNRMAHDPPTAGLLAEVTQRIQAAVADIRRVVHDLRPPALDELGLVHAIEESALQARHEALEIVVEGPSEQLPHLPAAVEVAAYRIAQEAVSNVSRHAGATLCRVRIALDQDAGLLELTIEDNGRGGVRQRLGGVGLGSMRERAEELGGTLTIEPAATGGTCVTARLPSPALAAGSAVGEE